MEKNYKKMINTMHRAIKQYNLISDGDKIAVGISGGKDSLTLLKCLAYYKKHPPFKFELIAIAVDIFGNTDYSEIEALCNKLEVEFFAVKTSIHKVVFDIRKEQNPCSLCANLRRGTLNSTAKQLGCNKVALGHHADDFVQTFFMSLAKENRLSSFYPKTYLSRVDLTVIRPFVFVWEHQIIAKSAGLPIITNTCPANKLTEREKVKNTLLELEKTYPNLRENILSALTHPERRNLF